MGSETLILGGGLAGLAAGWALTQAGRRVQVLEGGSTVGGLARTIVRDGFRFDLGGHRFLTSDARVERLVRELLGPELVTAPRARRIYLRGVDGGARPGPVSGRRHPPRAAETRLPAADARGSVFVPAARHWQHCRSRARRDRAHEPDRH